MGDIPQRNIRWQSVKNQTNPKTTIPGFALMVIDGSGVENGKTYFSVRRATSSDESLQNGATLLINGPTPIPPPDSKGKGGFGMATADWPARVLSKESVLSSSSLSVGFKADSWYAQTKSNGPLLPIERDAASVALGKDEFLLWVTSAISTPAIYGAAFRVSATVIPVGGSITPMATTYREPGASSAAGSGVQFSTSTDKQGLVCEIPGTYLTGFSTSIYSLTAPRGALLSVGLFLDGVATSYTAVRAQNIEEDQYGANIQTAMENVAQSGPLQIGAGQCLSLRNTSDYPIVATPATLWAMLQFAHAVEVAS